MQSATNPEFDQTPEVAPEIRNTTPRRLVSVTALSEMHLQVTFVDGTQGNVDLSAFLEDPKVEGTRTPDFFARVDLRMGAVHWPNGAALALETMYDAIHQHSCWVVR